jgi:hypothetical protein
MEGAIFKEKIDQTHCFLYNGKPGNHVFKAAKLVYEIYDIGGGQIVCQLVHQEPIDPTEQQKNQVLTLLESASQNAASK